MRNIKTKSDNITAGLSQMSKNEKRTNTDITPKAIARRHKRPDALSFSLRKINRNERE